MKAGESPWTESVDARLKELVLDRLSSSRIAMRLNHEFCAMFSRCAVIGRCHTGEEFFVIAGKLVRLLRQRNLEVLHVNYSFAGKNSGQGADLGTQHDRRFAVIADGIAFRVAFGASTELPAGKDGTPFCKAL